MPSINGTTTEDTGSVFTSFTGSANTTSQNFTFASQQDGMRFSNKGNSAMSVTINGKTHKIPPNAVIEIDDDPFDSFDVVTASGTNSFEGRAYTRKGGSSSGVDAYARAQLAEKIQHSETTWLNLPSPNYISHRGVDASAPENTMAAFELSAQQGFPIGMDLYETLDGVVVCRHDNDLATKSDASGLITSSLYSSFHNASAGLWMGESFKNEKVPTFEQVLNKYGGKHLIMAQIYGTQGDSVFTRMANIIKQKKLEKYVVFEVNSVTDMDKLLAVNPNLLVCITSGQPSNLATISDRAFMVNWQGTTITQAGIDAAKAKGLKVQAYGATKALANTLITMGVDFINCSDPLYYKGGITFQTPFALPVGKDNFGGYWDFTEAANAPKVNDSYIGYVKAASVSNYSKKFYGYTTKANDLISFELKFVDILPSTAYVNLLVVDDIINWNESLSASSSKNLINVQIYANGKIQTYNVVNGAVTNSVTDTTAFTAYANGESKNFSVKLTSTGITLTTPQKAVDLTMTPVNGQIALRYVTGTYAGFKNVKIENNG